MPEAAVHEHRHFRRWEDDIRASTDSWQDRPIDSKAEARAVQFASNRKFRGSITLPG
jgi:hypothetical protein